LKWFPFVADCDPKSNPLVIVTLNNLVINAPVNRLLPDNHGLSHTSVCQWAPFGSGAIPFEHI